MQDSFFFDSSHERLYDQLAAFTQKHVAPRPAEPSREIEASEARTIIRLLADQQLLRYVVPKKFGGHSERIDVRSVCLIREALAYQSGLSDLMFAMQGLGSYPITLAGSEQTKREFLPSVADGSKIAAFAITEPEAGSDVGALSTIALRNGNQYFINGEKKFISNAGLADFYVVFAKTDTTLGNKGISAFVVDKDSPGLTIDSSLELIAPHPIGVLKLEDCRVSEARRLGDEGYGFKLAMRTLDTFRATVGAAAIGMARRALDEAITYSRNRHQFGRPISEFQATQISLAEMATALDAARLLVYRAAWLADTTDEKTTRESAMAKLATTESAQKIIDNAVQIHGGNGLVKGATVERLYREIRALRIYEGTSEIQKLVIAKTLFT
ncbi:MAG TPA: acyl-CoA dehydrogenase family protein [Blastocatellia bacterium]|nr:acyl-CoA dehydrogenase family protein [Blastocatellia bacterium]